jgi:hypothetical protein
MGTLLILRYMAGVLCRFTQQHVTRGCQLTDLLGIDDLDSQGIKPALSALFTGSSPYRVGKNSMKSGCVRGRFDYFSD